MKKHHLILLPGMDGTGKLFAPLLNLLPGHFEPHVVAFPPDEQLNYEQLFPVVRSAIPWGEPYSIIAESFSGPLALLFAQEQRTDIQSIILCATFVQNPAPPWLASAVSLLGPKLLKAKPRADVLKKFAVGDNATEALLDQVLATMESLNPEVMVHRLKTVLKVDATKALKAFDRPMLYLRATDDRIVWKHNAEKIKELKPDIQMVDIKSSHLLLQTQPREALQAITQFLDAAN